MVITGQDIVVEARLWLRTPFHHAGRVHMVGVDCIGLPICAAEKVGVEIPEAAKRADYRRGPDDTSLVEALDACLERREGEPQLGDVCLFKVPMGSGLYDWPWHCGLRSDLGIIHADAVVGSVHEDKRWGHWRRRLVACYQLPGVT